MAKKRRRTPPTPKKKAWIACSKYCRLRDAIAYCKEYRLNLQQFTRPEDIVGACCTCGSVKSWIRMDAGHFKGRGSGGGSGTYFDERNVNLQCKQCNAWKQGAPAEYEIFLIGKYGAGIIEELNRKHVSRLDMRDLAMQAMEIFYNNKYEELVAGLNK